MKKLLAMLVAVSAIAIVLSGCTKKTTTTGTTTSTDTPPAPPADSAIPGDTAE